MRNDMKIGVLLGIIVVMAAFYFFANRNKGLNNQPVDNPPMANPENNDVTQNGSPNSQVADSSGNSATSPPANLDAIETIPPVPTNPPVRETDPIVPVVPPVASPPSQIHANKIETPIPPAPTNPVPEPITEEKPPRYHTVAPGDSLYTIAEMYYGHGRFADVIYQANKNLITNPDRLREKWKLRIPYPEEIAGK